MQVCSIAARKGNARSCVRCHVQKNPDHPCCRSEHRSVVHHGLQQTGLGQPSRRQILVATPLFLAAVDLARSGNASAFEATPAGYSRHVDRLDGYSFVYPDQWIPVSTSGNDVFYRNSRVPDENVFVDISSPSSSNYASVEDLGTPEVAQQRLRKQFFNEYMSTRIGITREIEPFFAESRKGGDGKLYYDIGVRVQSYASRQQLAVTGVERQDAIVQEFDRVLVTTLGVANKRLYKFRLQTRYDRFRTSGDAYSTMVRSFRCQEVDV